MLQSMGEKLAIYEDSFKIICSRISRIDKPHRLLKAMGYVYSDLLQFCFNICQLFSRKRSSM